MAEIEIGIAEMAVAKIPAVLITRSIGSCVGIALYDPINKIGGLVHVMNPDSNIIKNNKGRKNHAKFADLAVKAMVDKMIKVGAKKKCIIAKLVGGAKMFSAVCDNSIMNIGARIVKASKTALEVEGIDIVAEDVGRNYGRMIEFDTRNGSMKIKSIGKPVKFI